MRPSLASRVVCRRILVPHGLSSPASISALSGLRHASSPRSTRPRRALVYPSSRRTFLNLFKKPPREIKHVGLEPGFEKMLEFRVKTLDKVKPPSDEELLQSFRVFFDRKITSKRPVNSTQALVALEAFEHLQAENMIDDEPPDGEGSKQASKISQASPRLSIDDLQKALRALAIQHREGASEAVVELATALYTELQALEFAWIRNREDERKDKLVELRSDSLRRYITILVDHKQTGKAAEMLTQFRNLGLHDEPLKEDEGVLRNKLLGLHIKVLIGYGREADYDRLRSHAQMLCDEGFPYNPFFQRAMTNAFASKGEDGEKELREWFEKPVDDGEVSKMTMVKLPHPSAYLDLVNFASQTGRQPEWIKTTIQELCDWNPPKRWWDVIFRWAVHQDKDIGHIRNMVDVLAQVNPEDESVRVDIETINGMLEAALAKNSLFLAERINSMASELGLRPDEHTHMALLQARIAGQDKIGAASTFNEIIHSGPFLPSSLLSQAANLYIRFACTKSSSADVTENVSRFEARHGELEPETVMEVCMKLLRDDQIMEVVDTLGLHLNQFSMAERRLIRVEFVQYCLDMSISTARAWDAYSLLRQFWPETTREERTRLMQAFFSRKRPDMAAHVFGHMRAHPDDSLRPDLDLYVLCLENMGAYPDSDSLAMIYNMFKMDAMIQPSTKMYNAFIIAYTGCNQPRKAFEFWRQVANSKDGPTYKSLELVFRACQKLPHGYDRAKVIWDKMVALEVDVPAEVYDAFTLMLAGQAELDKAKAMLLGRHAEFDQDPAQILLARVYNALPYSNLQKVYREWAALEFPEKWQKIEKIRKTKSMGGTDRILLPPERVTAE